MRRAVPVLLLLIPLIACGPTPEEKKEQEATQQVLVNAHVARAAVIHLTMQYEKVVAPSGRPADSPAPAWEDAAAYRGSPEGLAASQFLSAFVKPAPVDASFVRAKDLEEAARATAALAALALEPRGTWDSFAGEMNGLRARLDQAVATLEKGTKNHVLIQIRTETNIRTAVYTDALAKARSGREAPEAAVGAEKKP